MKNQQKIEKKALIRTVPYRTEVPKDYIITTRFTKREKEEIDTIVQEYGTTLTDFVRNAVFYFIKINQDQSFKNKGAKINPQEVESLEKVLHTMEDRLNVS